MSHSWIKLDSIMRQYSPRLRDDLGLTPSVSNSLASTIALEVQALPGDVLRSIRDEDVIGLQRVLMSLWLSRDLWILRAKFRRHPAALLHLREHR